MTQEVQVQGRELTARLVPRHAGGQDSPLGAVGDIVVGLARLLEQEVLVRSAARLARELPDAEVTSRRLWALVLEGIAAEGA